MHVFCPDCNAEYKVNERSSLTKTIKFVCIECGHSWVDKFKKLEPTKKASSVSKEPGEGGVVANESIEFGQMDLNSLALEEVQNSFGNHEKMTNLINNNSEGEHFFKFETSEPSNKIGEEGPSKTFPNIRIKEESTTNRQIEERDAKEIEIEKRLHESSELLKRAKQPQTESKETLVEKNRPNSRKLLVITSILLVVGFFSYNLTVIFQDEILNQIPFAPEILSEITRYTGILKEIIFMIIENVMAFIPR